MIVAFCEFHSLDYRRYEAEGIAHIAVDRLKAVYAYTGMLTVDGLAYNVGEEEACDILEQRL